MFEAFHMSIVVFWKISLVSTLARLQRNLILGMLGVVMRPLTRLGSKSSIVKNVKVHSRGKVENGWD